MAARWCRQPRSIRGGRDPYGLAAAGPFIAPTLSAVGLAVVAVFTLGLFTGHLPFISSGGGGNAVQSGHGDVREYQIGRSIERFLERLMAVVRLIDQKTVALQRRRIKLSRLRVVFDDENQR